MIVDLAMSSFPREFTCDVCIVGAGPAGISLALELARARPDWQILLLESGGPDAASTQDSDTYDVDLGEKSYSVLGISRRRQLGGTTAHWGGWSKPLDDIDYRDNPSWDVPAWPIGPEELKDSLNKALKWCEIDNGHIGLPDIRQRHSGNLLPLRPAGPITERIFVFSPPARFGARYQDDLQKQENLTCLLHANLYELNQRNDRISRASVRTSAGESIAVQARQFVLAAGGMEVTRMLLNLRGEAQADGEGIYSPHLGRYFADHYGVTPGLYLAPEELQYHRFSDSSGPVMPVLTFSEHQLEHSHQNNSCIMLFAQASDESMLAGYGGRPALGFHSGNYWHYQAQMIVEPRPNPESRLTLTDERCELGLRRLKLDWKVHSDDFESAYQLFQTLGDELAQTGLGRLRLTRPDSPELRANVSGACHHMGTTRMAARSSDGVVDTNMKVFGTENLYVASSSVFPRYGYSNPTLMIVALAVRLADHLADEEMSP